MPRYGLICFLLWFGLEAQATNPEVRFIENKCQWPQPIQFLAHTSGGAFIANPNSFSYIFLDKSQIEDWHEAGHHPSSETTTHALSTLSLSGHRVDVLFKGANKIYNPLPFGRFPEHYNYFLGNNSSNWSSSVAAYEGLLYPNIYQGIDLKVYSQSEHIKYEFLVSPGADVTQIELVYDGINKLFIREGDLIGEAGIFSFIEKKPFVYQRISGKQIQIDAEYTIIENRVQFKLLSAYDPCLPLVIDPILIFSTYSGSTADNWGSTATPGEKGTLYSAGVTNLQTGGSFPATTGAFQVDYGGVYDIGILKYDSTGTQLLYATYLGGTGSESPHSLVINQKNELIILGTTGSQDFPTSINAFDRVYNGGSSESNVIGYPGGSDIFIARISTDGRQLLSSTFLGGSSNDGLNPTGTTLVANYGDQLRGDIIADEDGNIFVSTVTASSDFPVRNGFDLTFNGGITDALIIKMNPELSDILWASFIGGNGLDASHTIKFDPDKNVVLGGGTTSINFPVTSGTYQTTHAGSADGWIARIDKSGTSILNATYTGTLFFNQVYFVDLDTEGYIYAYGQTVGAFPTTTGVYKNTNSGQFLQKFNPALTELIFSTVFGSGRGIPDISPTAFLVNDCNNIYMSGWGGSINSLLGFWNSSTAGMPITNDAIQKTTSGSDFYFILLTSDASELLYATYLGGTTSKTHVDGGTSRFDKSGIVYHAVCAGCAALNNLNRATSDFPTTAGAWSNLNRSNNCNNAAFKFDLSLLKARIRTNSVALDNPGLNHVCMPDKIVFENKSTGGQHYRWEFGDGNTQLKNDTSRIIYQYADPGVYTVKLVAIDQGTCIGIDSTFTTVSVFKIQSMAGPDQIMCFDAGTTLIASGGDTYDWSTSDNSFESSLQNPIVNPKKDTEYTVKIIDENSCVNIDTVNVRVVPGIDLKWEYDRVYDCFSRPILEVENLTETDAHTFFDFGDGFTSDLPLVQHHYQQDGTYLLRLVGVRESCVYEDVVTLPIYTLMVPNVITPDDNPQNNFFQVIFGGVSIVQAQLNVSLNVYNRWGNIVYANSSYQGEWSGDNVEAGIYYYEILVQNETTCKGWVHVVK